MEIPLLKVLADFGEPVEANKVYPEMRKYFPNITDEDLNEPLQSGGNKWINRIQWVRQTLIRREEISSPKWGVWQITEKGKRRLRVNATPIPEPSSPSISNANPQSNPQPNLPETNGDLNLEDISEAYLESFKQLLLNKLHDLTPERFEHFAAALLKGYGFQNITVTGRPSDGGIDGYGHLKVGLASIKAAFQCKRWQNQVGSQEIQKFRGAIQGQYEQGYFFTTSTFSKAAQDESIKAGAASIILFDGRQIVSIMIEKGIGIRRRPVETYEDQLDQIFEN